MADDVVAFVGGATGYTGRHLVEALVARGAQVHAHVRPDSSQLESVRRHLAELGGEIGAEVDTTAWDETAMAARLADLRPTHVFSLLGTTRARARDEGRSAHEAYESVDYGLTMCLLRAAAAAPSRPRFVYLSAAGVGESEPSNPYMHVRWRVEKELREGDLPYTIVRPSFITGDDRAEPRKAERIAARIGDGALAIAGALGGRRLRDRYASLTGAELAAGLVRVALDPAYEQTIVHAEELR